MAGDDDRPGGIWLAIQETVRRELVDLNDQLRSIRIQLNGDGTHPGVAERLGILTYQVQELRRTLDTALTDRENQRREDARGRWAVRVAIITSTSALVAQLVNWWLATGAPHG